MGWGQLEKAGEGFLEEVGLTVGMECQQAELERMGETWEEHPGQKSMRKLSGMRALLPRAATE